MATRDRHDVPLGPRVLRAIERLRTRDGVVGPTTRAKVEELGEERKG